MHKLKTGLEKPHDVHSAHNIWSRALQFFQNISWCATPAAMRTIDTMVEEYAEKLSPLSYNAHNLSPSFTLPLRPTQ